MNCFFLELLSVPPGFKRGLVFSEDGVSLNKSEENKISKTFGDLPDVTLLNLLSNEPGRLSKYLFFYVIWSYK